MTIRHYEFDRCQKSDKTPFFIYEDLESLIKNWMDVKNNPEVICSKIREHIPKRFSMYKIFSFKHIENKHDVYRGKKCIKIVNV